MLLGGSGPARAQDKVRSAIYSCTDSTGKVLRSDRPIADCTAKEQRLLNADGSTARLVPPTPTAEERAEMEQRQRELDSQLAARNDAVRRDRNLVQRFPNEPAHQKARAKALDDIRASVKISESRVADLRTERKKLDEELLFYPDAKKIPFKLRLQVDANDATMGAQQALIANQESEVGRINAIYDAELLRLKKLWAGAPLGSLGPAPVVAATPVPPPKNPTR